MLILNNEEIESLISLDLAFSLLEKAYKAQAEGRAVNRPRADLYVPSATEGGVYAFKSMEGGLADPPVVALRLNSDVIRWESRAGTTVKDKLPKAPGGKWVGLVLLFSAETGEPLAIFPDGVMQRLRVAATSALAAEAAEDAAAGADILVAATNAASPEPGRVMSGHQTAKAVRVALVFLDRVRKIYSFEGRRRCQEG